MNNRIVRWGLVAVAAAALVAVGIVLLTGKDTGAQPSPGSSPAQGPGSTPSAQTGPGTLLITYIYEPGDDYDVYLVRSDGTGLKRLTAGDGNEEHAYWSPDGTRIVYQGSLSSSRGIWVMNADGSGKHYLGAGESPSWSPDGKQILSIGDFGPPKYNVIFVMDADGSGRPSVVPLPFSPSYPTWAANGKIVLVRPRPTESGTGGGDLYAVSPDGSGLERLTNGLGLSWPSVSPDGSTIAAYSQGTDRLITVPYGEDGPAVTLLAGASGLFPNGGVPLARWTPDGRRLVLGSSNEGEFGGAGLFLVNADGSGLTRIPDVTQAISPDWRPE